MVAIGMEAITVAGTTAVAGTGDQMVLGFPSQLVVRFWAGRSLRPITTGAAAMDTAALGVPMATILPPITSIILNDGMN